MTASLVQLALLEPMGRKARMAHRDLRVPPDQPVLLEQTAKTATRDRVASPVQQAQLDLREPTVRTAKLARLVRLALSGHRGTKDQRDLPERTGQMATTAHKVLLDQPG